jgi:hypothetical protein
MLEAHDEMQGGGRTLSASHWFMNRSIHAKHNRDITKS